MDGGSEERQTSFRTELPQSSLGGGQPQTGLSVLLNNSSVSASQVQSSAVFRHPSTDSAFLGPEHRQRQQEELADRERQASSLAAAGMVAESVRMSQPSGLQPPPQLVSGAAVPVPSPSQEIDGINWNLMDIGAAHLDDMDLDFAQLFDPANELAGMQTEGTGWPTSGAAPTDGSGGMTGGR